MRRKADTILANEAMKIFQSKNASLGERLAALSVAGVMKAKVKMGMGLTKPNNKQTIRKCMKLMEKAKTLTQNTLKNIEDGIGILKGNETVDKTRKQPKTKSNNKKRKMGTKKKEKVKEEPLLISPIDENVENMEIDVDMNRKRKLNDDDEVTKFSNNNVKKIRLNNNQNSNSRKVRLGKRRLQHHTANTNSSQEQLITLDQPLNHPTLTGQKRKLINDDNDDMSQGKIPKVN